MHIKCVNITNSVYEALGNSGLLYVCVDCENLVKRLIENSRCSLECSSDTSPEAEDRAARSHPEPMLPIRPMLPNPKVDNRPSPKVENGPSPKVDSGPSPKVDSGHSPKVDRGPSPKPKVDSGARPKVGSGSRAGWATAKNGKGKQKPESKPKVELKNRFLVLGNMQEEVACEFTLIGDSIIREQEELFCNKGRRARRRFCIPGGRVKDVTDVVKTLGESRGSIIVNVGTNNMVQKPKVRGARPIVNRNSVDLYSTYSELVTELGARTNKSVLVGILPRMDATREILSRIIGINVRLKTLCESSGVGFIDMWASFFGAGFLFKEDGLHLNSRGSRVYAKLLEQGLIALGF
jgi:hypothetical protein